MTAIDYAQIARTQCRGGVTISTIRTRRNAYETAVCAPGEIEVVENYEDAKAALAGHARYVRDHCGPVGWLRATVGRLVGGEV